MQGITRLRYVVMEFGRSQLQRGLAAHRNNNVAPFARGGVRKYVLVSLAQSTEDMADTGDLLFRLLQHPFILPVCMCKRVSAKRENFHPNVERDIKRYRKAG